MREIIYSGSEGEYPSLLRMQCDDGGWYLALFDAAGGYHTVTAPADVLAGLDDDDDDADRSEGATCPH